MTSTRFETDKATIRVELEKRARSGETISYEDAAKLVGRIARGLGGILKAIRHEEAAHGWPDLSCLVVSETTNLPSYVGRSQEERDEAMALRQAVFAAHTSRGLTH